MEPLTPKKTFGQHFLIRQGAIEGIARAALASPAERILEIGPGSGALTEPLLRDGRPLWAVELDSEACAVMDGRFGDLDHFHLLRGDAVRTPLPEGPPWSVVGNLPYNAATAILGRFLTELVPWERMVFMFQREVGEKLMGGPGEKQYGPLSILAQLSARMTRLMRLDPGAFRPAPKVESVVLLFEPRNDAPPLAARARLLTLLHRSFAHRRKTLANNWLTWLGPAVVAEILAALGLPPAVRAEAVPPATWLTLLEAVQNHDPDLHSL